MALLGSSLSDRQRELLVDAVGPRGKLTLLFDGDEAGRNCQAQCLAKLSKYVYVKVIELAEPHSQPDHLTDYLCCQRALICRSTCSLSLVYRLAYIDQELIEKLRAQRKKTG